MTLTDAPRTDPARPDEQDVADLVDGLLAAFTPADTDPFSQLRDRPATPLSSQPHAVADQSSCFESDW